MDQPRGTAGRVDAKKCLLPLVTGHPWKLLKTDLGPVPSWTLDWYWRECAGLTNVKRYIALAIDGSNLVMYDRNRFERDTALAACK